MALTLAVPGARSFLGLVFPAPTSLALIGGATLAALILSRLAATPQLPPPPRLLALPAPGETSEPAAT
jgi:hypothetical protein